MSDTNTGGPAFPATQVEGGCDGIGKKDGVWHFPGMTLRDYFAAKALPICYQNYMHDYFHPDHQNHEDRDSSNRGEFMGEDKNAIAELAYEMADAMLRAREQS
jgi:hypothetical protein